MEREAILKLKQDGMTYKQIAVMIGKTRTRAMQLINGEGAEIEGPCADCGETKPLHRHHESYWPEQVVHLCRPCHGRRHVGKFMRHKKVIDALKPGTVLTEKALAAELGVHHNYAAIIGRQFGFTCVRFHSVPWAGVNWNIPNKWLARIWRRLDHVVSSARNEQKAPKSTFDWRDPIVGEFKAAIVTEAKKRMQWIKTGEITS